MSHCEEERTEDVHDREGNVRVDDAVDSSVNRIVKMRERGEREWSTSKKEGKFSSFET